MQKNTAKEYEKKFHDKYVDGSYGLRQAQSIFYSRRVQDIEYSLIFTFLGALAGKRLLFYGCGGHFSLMKAFAERGATVVGIDISPMTVKKLQNNIDRAGIGTICRAMEMDCEHLEFSPSSFDIVFGRSIIHHLDVRKSLDQINFVLKPEGKCAFIEPLGTNPVINIYRRITPQDRTPTEHPLKREDLNLFNEKFSFTEFHYLYALALLAFFLRTFPGTEKIFWTVFKILNRIDKVFLSLVPPYRLLCWDVIILCRK